MFTQPKGPTKGQKTFFCQNLFQLMHNHKQKSNAPLRKKHKWADRKGGWVNPYGQPDRKISVFFLTTFLREGCLFNNGRIFGKFPSGLLSSRSFYLWKFSKNSFIFEKTASPNRLDEFSKIAFSFHWRFSHILSLILVYLRPAKQNQKSTSPIDI